MRKQYDCYETRSFKYDIILYHDGVKVAAESKWFGDELNAYIDGLESEGYTRGYTKDDVEKARKHYEYLYENRIERD